jgi:hypothetical protein
MSTTRLRTGLAVLVAALALLGAGTLTTTPAASAAATSDPLAVAQGQLAGCQAWLAAHPGSTSAQHTRMVQCVTDEQAIITALTAATPSPSPSTTPSASPSPTAGPTTPPPTSAPPTTQPPSPTPAPTTTSPTPSPTVNAGWPDASNTGVPFGVVRTAYTGPCTITTPGTTIDAKTINCDLTIKTHDVTITRSLINGSIGDGEPQNCAGCSFTLDQVEVNAGPEVNPAVWHTTLTVTRSNIHGGQTAVSCVQACTVKDSWLHGQVHNTSVADQHFGGFLSNGGGSATAPSLIQHDTIACDVPESTVGGGTSSCSGDVNLYGDFGGVSYYSFINNLLVAPTDPSQGTPSFCAYGGTGKAGLPDHIVYQDNVFMRGLPGNGGQAHCGWWGAATNFDANAPGDVWTGNHYQDNGEVIPAPGP